MLKTAKRFLAGLGGASGVMLAIASSGGTAAAAIALGPWAYPAFFMINMALSAVVLLLPDLMNWLEQLVIRVAAWLYGVFGKTMQPGESFLERMTRSKWWNGVRRRGAGWTVLAAALVVGPIVAAIVARSLRLNSRRTWKYVTVGNLVATCFWMSLYLGLFGALWSAAKSLLGMPA